jgi:TRAP-type mannitol/chloroaromatic compound transport system permease small subunit
MLGEQSDSTVGLTHRWIIKGVYAAGLWMVVLGIVSVLLRVLAFLFGAMSEREVKLQIGHVISDV